MTDISLHPSNTGEYATQPLTPEQTPAVSTDVEKDRQQDFDVRSLLNNSMTVLDNASEFAASSYDVWQQQADNEVANAEAILAKRSELIITNARLAVESIRRDMQRALDHEKMEAEAHITEAGIKEARAADVLRIAEQTALDLREKIKLGMRGQDQHETERESLFATIEMLQTRQRALQENLTQDEISLAELQVSIDESNKLEPVLFDEERTLKLKEYAERDRLSADKVNYIHTHYPSEDEGRVSEALVQAIEQARQDVDSIELQQIMNALALWQVKAERHMEGVMLHNNMLGQLNLAIHRTKAELEQITVQIANVQAMLDEELADIPTQLQKHSVSTNDVMQAYENLLHGEMTDANKERLAAELQPLYNVLNAQQQSLDAMSNRPVKEWVAPTFDTEILMLPRQERLYAETMDEEAGPDDVKNTYGKTQERMKTGQTLDQLLPINLVAKASRGIGKSGLNASYSS